MQVHHVYIGMGSNVPEGIDLLARAALRLKELAVGEVFMSSPETTEAIDFPWPALFVNQVVSLVTALDPDELNSRLKHIERELGRTPKETRRGVIRLDLDLLSYDDQILRRDDWERAYIQRGIAEIREGSGACEPD